MKYIVLLVFIAFIATTTNASNLRSHTAVDTIASIMGKNSLYTSIVRSLKQDAPAKVIVNKMNELQAVLTTRLAHVKDGCEIDQKHFLQRLLIVSENVTKVNASVTAAKKCVAEEIATEQDIGEEIQAELKTLIPHSKFESAKAHLSQIRKRATKLMKAHDARHDRYQKEQVMFKNQDKILSHVMGTIEAYYKKKSVNKEAVQQSEHSVATVLLETVAPKSKVHRAVVTKLLEIVSNKTTTPKKGTEEEPVVTKKKVSIAPKAAKSKVLAGTIYEAITELKGTFVNEQKIRTLRYETRKDEHVQEIQQLSKEEGDIKNEVTNYIASNKNITKRVNKMKFNLNKALDKQKECKKESTSLAVDLKKLQTRKTKRKFALNHTKTLCNAQIKDILKEVKLATYISGLISKRVKKIQEALQKFEKETSDVNGATGNGHAATGSSGTGGANSVGDIEKQIKNSEQCAKLGVAFWCKNEANMKQCGVSALDCKRMMKDNVAQDLTNDDNSSTGGNAAEDAHSIRQERMKKKKKAEERRKRLATGSTGPTASGSTGSSTGGTGISSGEQLQDAASKGTATGPSAENSASSTGAIGTATKNAQRQSDFQKLLKIFDQDKDQRIGWDEIIAVTGHEDPKMKREFQKAAGNDMKMNYKEFHKFMNKETKTGFFFM